MNLIIIYSVLLLLGSFLYINFFPIAVGVTKEERKLKTRDQYKVLKLTHALFIGLGLAIIILSSHDLSLRLGKYLGIHKWFWEKFPRSMSSLTDNIIDILFAGLLAAISFVIIDTFSPKKWRKLF
ncbi:MAG: hypothetical protein IPP08_09985 [Chlorobiota bacterium]|jgi:hypothetical protein|nr:hypothetical protein [Chlorobiota bacterium]QQS66089.1 MAG: hypothetical protein IPP08_09985 [Chlorobiota bacterium]